MFGWGSFTTGTLPKELALEYLVGLIIFNWDIHVSSISVPWKSLLTAPRTPFPPTPSALYNTVPQDRNHHLIPLPLFMECIPYSDISFHLLKNASVKDKSSKNKLRKDPHQLKSIKIGCSILVPSHVATKESLLHQCSMSSRIIKLRCTAALASFKSSSQQLKNR